MEGLSAAYLAKALVKTVLLPPGLAFVALAIGGLCLRRGRRRLGWAVMGSVLAVHLILSLPLVAQGLTDTLIQHPPFGGDLQGAEAIVILGGGLTPAAPEYGGDVVGSASLRRCRYGAWLHRRTKLPILVSGGRPIPTELSEAEAMAQTLVHEFRVSVRWQETRSEDTTDNARYSAEILKAAGIARVLLVTDATHMLRAALAFRQAGLTVVPAPTRFPGTPPLTVLSFLPKAGALSRSTSALNHWLGLAVYTLRGWVGAGERPDPV